MRPHALRRLGLAAACLVPACLTALSAEAVTPTPEPREEATYSFAVVPDVFNQDIGDVRGQLGWQPGDPNSWTPELATAVDTVLDEIATHQPASVLVPGDLVQGHWGRDDMRTGIFGPTRTNRQRAENLRRAGSFYHSQNAAELADRGFTVHAAVGDHDIGDGPWRGASDRLRFKRHHVDTFRALFARHYNQAPDGTRRYDDRPTGSQWSDTAYAVQLHPDVLLVTLDEFDEVGRDVRARVVGKQLAWLERTLASARRRGVPWVVVQGHLPVLTPVRTHASSGMSLDGGRTSPLWRVMRKGGVDLYLCGEVHDTSLRQADGVTQVASGGPVFQGQASYLTVDVHPDRMELTAHEFAGQQLGPHRPIWQGSNMKTEGNLAYPTPSTVVGSVTLTATGTALDATGKLAPYLR